MKLWLLLCALLLVGVACTRQGDFTTPACSRGNSNCELPSLQVEVVGSDGSSQSHVGNEGEAGVVDIKTIRFGESARIEFVLQNPRLPPPPGPPLQYGPW